MDRVASNTKQVIRVEMTFAVLLTLLAAAGLPLLAQHGHGGGGGFHGGGGGFRSGGGFASRPASSFRPSAGVGAPRALRPAGVGRSFPTRPLNAAPYRSAPGFRPGYGARRPSYPGRYPHRPAYNYGDGVVYSGAIASYGYGPGYGYGDLGFPYDDGGYDNAGYDNSQQNSAYDQGNNYVAEAAPEAIDPQPYGSSSAPYYSNAPQAQMPAAPNAAGALPQEAVTLIFNNGAPSERIHNYILSRDTLTVLDGRRRQIPVASIDIDATERANRAAGVDFALPVSR